MVVRPGSTLLCLLAMPSGWDATRTAAQVGSALLHYCRFFAFFLGLLLRGPGQHICVFWLCLRAVMRRGLPRKLDPLCPLFPSRLWSSLLNIFRISLPFGLRSSFLLLWSFCGLHSSCSLLFVRFLFVCARPVSLRRFCHSLLSSRALFDDVARFQSSSRGF